MKALKYKLISFSCFLIFIGGCSPKNFYQFQSSTYLLPPTSNNAPDSLPILTAQLEPNILVENQTKIYQTPVVNFKPKSSLTLLAQKPLSLPKKIINPLVVKSKNNLKSLKAHDVADGDYIWMFVQFVLGILLIIGIIVGLIILIF